MAKAPRFPSAILYSPCAVKSSGVYENELVGKRPVRTWLTVAQATFNIAVDYILIVKFGGWTGSLLDLSRRARIGVVCASPSLARRYRVPEVWLR